MNCSFRDIQCTNANCSCLCHIFYLQYCILKCQVFIASTLATSVLEGLNFRLILSGESNSAPTTEIAQKKLFFLDFCERTVHVTSSTPMRQAFSFQQCHTECTYFHIKICHGGKKSKGRLTAILYANMDSSENSQLESSES